MRIAWWWGALALGVAGCAAGSADSGTTFGRVTVGDTTSQGDADTSGSSTGFLTTSVSADAGENGPGASADGSEADTSASDTGNTGDTSDTGDTSGTTSPVSDGSDSTSTTETTETTAEDDEGDTNGTSSTSTSTSTSTTGGQQGGQPDSGMYSHCTLDNNTCSGAANICIHIETDGFCSDDGCVDPDVDCDPVPVDSNAPAMCVEALDPNMNSVFLCALDCSNGQTCPAGMVCVHNLSFGMGLPVYDMCM